MASDLNQTSLVGRLARDPELRQTRSGSSVTNLRLAFSTARKDANGNWTDKSNYVDVVVFGKQAENIARDLSKGSRIGVAGALEHEEWEAKDGGRRERVQILARSVQYLSPKGEQASAPADQRPPQAAPSAAPTDDEDIPF